MREGEVGPVEVEQGTLAANVAGYSVAITAKPVPPRIWAAMVRFARGNRPLEEAVEGRAQSVHLEHLMIDDWSEPLVPRPYELGRSCSCDDDGEPCEHVAALAFAVADEIDADPSLLLRWRGCVAAPELPDEAAIVSTPEPTVDLTDDDPWRGRTPRASPAETATGRSSAQAAGPERAAVAWRRSCGRAAACVRLVRRVGLVLEPLRARARLRRAPWLQPLARHLRRVAARGARARLEGAVARLGRGRPRSRNGCRRRSPRDELAGRAQADPLAASAAAVSPSGVSAEPHRLAACVACARAARRRLGRRGAR